MFGGVVLQSQSVDTTESAPASMKAFTRFATPASPTGPTPVLQADKVSISPLDEGRESRAPAQAVFGAARLLRRESNADRSG